MTTMQFSIDSLAGTTINNDGLANLKAARQAYLELPTLGAVCAQLIEQIERGKRK